MTNLPKVNQTTDSEFNEIIEFLKNNPLSRIEFLRSHQDFLPAEQQAQIEQMIEQIFIGIKDNASNP